ncbi:MAG: hypothetical protein GY821_06390 [Gammaproteobacteria bacterium]|nr:hypothetical protein [Gammaproteobacteria bacterium]
MTATLKYLSNRKFAFPPEKILVLPILNLPPFFKRWYKVEKHHQSQPQTQRVTVLKGLELLEKLKASFPKVKSRFCPSRTQLFQENIFAEKFCGNLFKIFFGLKADYEFSEDKFEIYLLWRASNLI